MAAPLVCSERAYKSTFGPHTQTPPLPRTAPLLKSIDPPRTGGRSIIFWPIGAFIYIFSNPLHNTAYIESFSCWTELLNQSTSVKVLGMRGYRVFLGWSEPPPLRLSAIFFCLLICPGPCNNLDPLLKFLYETPPSECTNPPPLLNPGSAPVRPILCPHEWYKVCTIGKAGKLDKMSWNCLRMVCRPMTLNQITVADPEGFFFCLSVYENSHGPGP